MWPALDQTTTEAPGRVAHLSPKDFQVIIGEATGQVRKEVRGPQRQDCWP